jgi:hypothetical protein
MAATLYGDLNFGQRVSAVDPAVEAIERVLAEIQESSVAVSAILQRRTEGAGTKHQR